MAELSERAASGSYQPTENAEAEATTLNQSALEFMFGAQRMMFQEFVFVTDEMLERTRTEMHLFHGVRGENGGRAFRQGHQDDVSGMRLASARFPSPRLRKVVQAWRADDRNHFELNQRPSLN